MNNGVSMSLTGSVTYLRLHSEIPWGTKGNVKSYVQ